MRKREPESFSEKKTKEKKLTKNIECWNMRSKANSEFFSPFLFCWAKLLKKTSRKKVRWRCTILYCTMESFVTRIASSLPPPSLIFSLGCSNHTYTNLSVCVEHYAIVICFHIITINWYCVSNETTVNYCVQLQRKSTILSSPCSVAFTVMKRNIHVFAICLKFCYFLVYMHFSNKKYSIWCVCVCVASCSLSPVYICMGVTFTNKPQRHPSAGWLNYCSFSRSNTVTLLDISFYSFLMAVGLKESSFRSTFTWGATCWELRLLSAIGVARCNLLYLFAIRNRTAYFLWF